MSQYTLVVFLHIAAAVLLLATSVVGEPPVRAASRRTKHVQELQAFLQIGRPMARLSPVAAFLVLGSGRYLTSLGRFWALGWVQASRTSVARRWPSMVGSLVLLAGTAPLAAQTLHTNNRWDDCAIVIDGSLTQEAWHQFVAEMGVVAYFRPLASARPLGAGRFEISLLQSSTRIDDTDAAWNDTFSHPDSTHWLFEGDALMIPGLMVRVGVTDRLDLGAYYTQAFQANYGLVGGQVQYGLLGGEARNLDLAARLSGVWLVGPDDLSAGVYGVDLVASREVWLLSPYAGVSGFVPWGREHSAKVDLDDEIVPGAQALVGVAARVSAVRLGAEVGFARVNSYAFKVAVAL